MPRLNPLLGQPSRARVTSWGSLPALLLLGVAACGESAPAAGIVDEAELEIRLPPEEAARLAQAANTGTSAVVTPGFELSLWAPEPLLADPVAISVDVDGSILYTRTNRSNRGEFDIRSHRDWMVESITFETVEDRRAFLHRTLAPERSDENAWLEDYNGDGSRDWRDLTFHRENVYRLRDTSGDGVADAASLLIADFNTKVTDVANGLLVHGEDVFLGIAPDVWRLRDTSGDGRLDSKESISHGYGVHIGFSGHGMSGLTIGPDGRLYWGIGDIGLNVTDRDGRQWAYPHQGAIMRAELDGSNFEVFAAGVRNTHEFAFDEVGNLISVDNDGDHSGERERIVYLVDGSDSGWRINWQFGKYDEPGGNSYKVWMDEGLWRPRFEGQAAYILPPIASYHAGPSGMVYNPGTALSPEWRNYFFVSAFTGSPANTRIQAFQLQPSGAGFELVRDTVVLRGILTTGIDVGPDGALYLADWIDGWNIKGRGRIWRLDTPDGAESAVRLETRDLLVADFGERANAALRELLGHPDMRVRTRPQFTLVDRGATSELLEAARQTDHLLARLHGLWGIGQLARRNATEAEPLAAFLSDDDAEVRAQAAKVIGDVRYAPAGPALIPLLADTSPRVRFFAAEALGRIGHAPAIRPIIDMLIANDDEDVYLRHAGSLALARFGDPAPIVALADHPSRAIRIAAVVALRRMGDAGVARFLDDPDEYVVTEAARAINDDTSIEAALPDLARMLEQKRVTDEPLLRRAVSANLRLGTPDAAARLASFAADDTAPEPMRVDALLALGMLPEPSVLDRVDGSPRGFVQRDPEIALTAIASVFDGLITGASVPLRVATAESAGRLRMAAAAPILTSRIEEDPSPDVRTAALRALAEIRVEPFEPIVRTALDDPDPSVRMVALELIPSVGLPDAVTTALLTSVIGQGTTEEQQSAVATLAVLRSPAAEEALEALMDRMLAGTLPPEVHLELLEGLDSVTSPTLLGRVEQLRSERDAGVPTVAFADALYGGNPLRGQQIVMRNQSAQCVRCHTFGDQGFPVGPDLRGVGARLDRQQILTALVDPNQTIADGYGITTVGLPNGETVSGTILEESEDALVLRTADSPRRSIRRSEIASRTDAPSAMPAMQDLLTRRQLRDVVEYLATLR